MWEVGVNETHFVYFVHIAVLPKPLYTVFLAEKHKEIYAKGSEVKHSEVINAHVTVLLQLLM